MTGREYCTCRDGAHRLRGVRRRAGGVGANPPGPRGSAELQRVLDKLKPIRALACVVVAAGMLLNEHLHAAPLWRLIVIPGIWALMAITHLLPNRTRKS
jgi:hypothetical protein